LLLADDRVDAATVELALPQAGAAPEHAGEESSGSAATGFLAQRVAAFERATLLAELESHLGHITNTAKALGLERSYFYKKCQQVGIDLKAERG
jgi:two-component system, NtrC family, nitrogen regulation response regulator NtrX